MSQYDPSSLCGRRPVHLFGGHNRWLFFSLLLTWITTLTSSGWGQTRITIPIRLNGKVVMEDGSSLPGPVPVVLTCRTRVMTSSSSARRELGPIETAETAGQHLREEVLSSPSGLFSFEFTVTREVEPRYQYASQRVDLTGCEVVAQAPGFVSSVIRLGIRDRTSNPNIGEIFLRPQSLPATQSVLVSSLRAPTEAKAAMRKAGEQLRQKNLSEAEKYLEEAVRIYPGYAEAWQLLGEVRQVLGDEAAARTAFVKAMEAEPRFLPPHLSLAYLEMRINNWGRVAALSAKALELDPSSLRARYYQAVSAFALEKFALAEEAARTLIASPQVSEYPMTYYVLGSIYAMRRDFPAAAEQFKRYLELQPNGAKSAEVRNVLQMWEQQGLIEP